MANCGECLFNDVEIVELSPEGICPRCKADYSAGLAQRPSDSYKDGDVLTYTPDPLYLPKDAAVEHFRVIVKADPSGRTISVLTGKVRVVYADAALPGRTKPVWISPARLRRVE